MSRNNLTLIPVVPRHTGNQKFKITKDYESQIIITESVLDSCLSQRLKRKIEIELLYHLMEVHDDFCARDVHDLAVHQLCYLLEGSARVSL